MFLCKWRARKQISLHRDNKVVLYCIVHSLLFLFFCVCVCCCFSVVVFVVLVFVGSLLFRVCFLLYPLSVFSTDSTHTLTSATHRPCVFFRDTTHWHQSHTLPVCFEWHNTLTSVTHPPCVFSRDIAHWHQSHTLPVCFRDTTPWHQSHTLPVCF